MSPRRRGDLVLEILGSDWSSSPGESHPEALTEPCLNLSIYTALHSRSLPLARANRLWRRRLLLVAQLAKPSIELCHPFRSPSITDASTLLQDDPPSPSASIFPFSWVTLIGFLFASLEDFPCSAYPPPWQAQATSHAGCRSAHKQVSSELIPQ